MDTKKSILRKHTQGYELFPMASDKDANAMYDGIYAAMEEYAYTISKWVSVDEKLPEDGSTILIQEYADKVRGDLDLYDISKKDDVLKIMGYSGKVVRAWKLVKIENDKIYPINANIGKAFPVNRWINAINYNNPKHTNDPWFHCMVEADDYYLTKPDSKFVEVELQYTRKVRKDTGRPDWILGKRMKIIREIST